MERGRFLLLCVWAAAFFLAACVVYAIFFKPVPAATTPVAQDGGVDEGPEPESPPPPVPENPFDKQDPGSPMNPTNPESPLNPENPASPLNPANAEPGRNMAFVALGAAWSAFWLAWQMFWGAVWLAYMVWFLCMFLAVVLVSWICWRIYRYSRNPRELYRDVRVNLGLEQEKRDFTVEDKLEQERQTGEYMLTPDERMGRDLQKGHGMIQMDYETLGGETRATVVPPTPPPRDPEIKEELRGNPLDPHNNYSVYITPNGKKYSSMTKALRAARKEEPLDSLAALRKAGVSLGKIATTGKNIATNFANEAPKYYLGGPQPTKTTEHVPEYSDNPMSIYNQPIV